VEALGSAPVRVPPRTGALAGTARWRAPDSLDRPRPGGAARRARETRPSVILAALNQALLDWLTDDPRFLTAIYATVRPTIAGASVHISRSRWC